MPRGHVAQHLFDHPAVKRMFGQPQPRGADNGEGGVDVVDETG
jgi:hypothetical protein